MFSNVDTTTLMFGVLMCCAAAYFIGTMMHGVLGEDGFGIMGNAVILLAGAAVGYYLSDIYIVLYGMSAIQGAVSGVSGGFLALGFLAISKATLNRFGF